MSESVRIVLAVLLFAPVTWGINFGPRGAPHRSGKNPTAHETCAAHFLTQLPSLLVAQTQAGISTLQGFGATLLRSGLTPKESDSLFENFQAMVNDREAPPLLRTASRAATEAWNRPQVLGICTLSVDGPDQSGAGHALYAGFPALVAPFQPGAGLEAAQAVVLPPFDPSEFWQGIVFQPFVSDGKNGRVTLMRNLQVLARDLAHVESRARLARWVMRIQKGEPPHPRLRPYVTSDGKTLDQGLWEVVGEARAVRTSFEAAAWFMGKASGNHQRAAELGRQMANEYVLQVMGNLRVAGPHVNRVLTDFAINEETFWDRAQELGDLLESTP